MKLILEKDEIVTIIGRHFDTVLDPSKVILRMDPFEMEVSGLPLASETQKHEAETNVVPLHTPVKATKAAEPLLRADPDASTEPPEPGSDGESLTDASVHPASVLAASKALEQQLAKENPKNVRRSGRWSEIPPGNPDDEI
jgi:hypothetical protein